MLIDLSYNKDQFDEHFLENEIYSQSILKDKRRILLSTTDFHLTFRMNTLAHLFALPHFLRHSINLMLNISTDNITFSETS